MQIGPKKVVKIAYTLKDDAGEVIDRSADGDPLVYIQGIGSLVPGLEKALEGRAAGEHVDVVVPPAEGYGNRDEALIRKLPIRKLPNGKAVVGSRIQVRTDQGPLLLLVTAVHGDYATVDPNHPLADKTLHFQVDIVEVRDATEDEIAHGHAHGPGGHH